MDDARRARFLRFVADHCGPDPRRYLLAETGLSKGRITQLFDPDEPFGERTGRNLAEKLDLPPDYFERDKPPPGELSDEAIAWAWEFERAPPSLRARLHRLYDLLREDPEPPDGAPSPSVVPIPQSRSAPERGLWKDAPGKRRPVRKRK